MKQTYIGPQHTYTRIEGELRERFLSELAPESAVVRSTVAQLVKDLVGGEHGERCAYAEGFVRAWFHETAPNMDNSYRVWGVTSGIPELPDADTTMDKHIQNGWINGRNTRPAEAS